MCLLFGLNKEHSSSSSSTALGHMDLGDLVALVSHLIQTICCGSLHLCRIATTVMSFCCTPHVYNIVYHLRQCNIIRLIVDVSSSTMYLCP